MVFSSSVEQTFESTEKVSAFPVGAPDHPQAPERSRIERSRHDCLALGGVQ